MKLCEKVNVNKRKKGKLHEKKDEELKRGYCYSCGIHENFNVICQSYGETPFTRVSL